LCFIHGAKLPDPAGILVGSGKQTRFVRLPTARSFSSQRFRRFSPWRQSAARLRCRSAVAGSLSSVQCQRSSGPDPTVESKAELVQSLPATAGQRWLSAFLLGRVTGIYMQTKKIVNGLSLILLLSCGSGVCASDGFSAIRCGSDIPKALVGRTIPNERVVVIEERHKDLGLKDLGGTEISERLFLISWLICGDEYVLLEENNVVRDVLKFPRHSKDAPQFIGACQLNGSDLPGTVIAVLKNEKDTKNLPATVAWKIDEERMKFISLPTEGLQCPRSGIITADGGL
jgi:hypothetical protein